LAACRRQRSCALLLKMAWWILKELKYR